MPNRIVRDEFASDAAQKLGIDSALVREELRQAARKRRDQVALRPGQPERGREGAVAGGSLALPESRVFLAFPRPCTTNPSRLKGLRVTTMLALCCAIAGRWSPWRLPDPSQRALLAQALLRESGEVEWSRWKPRWSR
jgi:DNA primase